MRMPQGAKSCGQQILRATHISRYGKNPEKLLRLLCVPLLHIRDVSEFGCLSECQNESWLVLCKYPPCFSVFVMVAFSKRPPGPGLVIAQFPLIQHMLRSAEVVSTTKPIQSHSAKHPMLS